MAYEFSISDSLISAIITILIASAFIHFAAKMVLDRSSFGASILTAIVGTLLASLVTGLLAGYIAGIWSLLIAVAVWALVAALFFRTDWIKGAIIGVVAWLLWFLVSLIVDAILG